MEKFGSSRNEYTWKEREKVERKTQKKKVLNEKPGNLTYCTDRKELFWEKKESSDLIKQHQEGSF